MKIDSDVSDEFPPPKFVLARYGELVLKGRNRHYFEKRLVRNVKQACKPIEEVRVKREHGQLVLIAKQHPERIARRLQDVFGLSVVSPAWESGRDPDEIAALATRLVGRALADFSTRAPVRFRVRTKRADKRFPLVSLELDHLVADRIFERHGDRLRADLTDPELTLGISVRRERVYLFAQRLTAAGGLPCGSTGKVLALLSGGIDSPVAAWMAMKRGLLVRLVTFESEEFLGLSPAEKVHDIAQRLAHWQPFTRLYHVPFADVQLAVREVAPERYRTVVYRRMMQRIATSIAEEESAGALVTGDSLGQVASQTLENLGAVQAATDLPVLRPLIAMDKQETITRARQIGTYELSIQPVPDCCTLFQPTAPILRATPLRAERAERELDVASLVRSARERARAERIFPTP